MFISGAWEIVSRLGCEKLLEAQILDIGGVILKEFFHLLFSFHVVINRSNNCIL